METTKPVSRSHAEAVQTSPQPKNLVKVKSGEILVSITCLIPAKSPVAKTQPINAEKTPSSKKGNWIDQEVAPTNFMTLVSRRRLNAAMRKVLLINSAAVNTDAKPTAKAPSRSTPRSLKNLSRILL